MADLAYVELQIELTYLHGTGTYMKTLSRLLLITCC